MRNKGQEKFGRLTASQESKVASRFSSCTFGNGCCCSFELKVEREISRNRLPLKSHISQSRIFSIFFPELE